MEMKLYDGVGHKITAEMIEDVIKFFKSNSQ